MTGRWMLAAVVGLGGASLACGGADPIGLTGGNGRSTGSGGPASSGASAPLVVAAPNAGKCVVTALPPGQVLATFDGGCAEPWFIAESPTKAGSFLVGMVGHPPQLDGKPLPEVPLTPPKRAAIDEEHGVDVDYAGFDMEGRVVAVRQMMAEVTFDERRKIARITYGGNFHTTDFELAKMYSIALCDTYTVGEDGAWAASGGPFERQLFEGSPAPWCLTAEGLPKLAPAARPSSETFPATEDAWTPPQAFAGFETEEGSDWYKLEGHPVASSGNWFEGLRLQTPVAIEVGGAWTVPDALKKPGELVALWFEGDSMLACTNGGNALYDLKSGAQSWSDTGPCPAFWPLKTTAEGP